MSGHLEGYIGPEHEAPESAVILVVESYDLVEEYPLIELRECRICQEEDSVNNLESPCACNGSLKFAHRKCVQFWCNEKGDTTCEICHELYRPGYTAPPRPSSDETTINIGRLWHITGGPLDLHDPRVLAFTGTEHELIEAVYDDDDYNVENSRATVFFRTAALVLMALLLLRHALARNDGGEEEASIFFSLFWIRAFGFVLPFYIMIWAITILQRRRQRHEAASRFAILVQSARNRGVILAASIH